SELDAKESQRLAEAECGKHQRYARMSLKAPNIDPNYTFDCVEYKKNKAHPRGRSDMTKPAKNTICLWYDGDAEDAARFYAKTFPDSSVGAVMRAPGDFPSGKKGDVLTVEFTVMGIPCLGLNGGPLVT